MLPRLIGLACLVTAILVLIALNSALAWLAFDLCLALLPQAFVALLALTLILMVTIKRARSWLWLPLVACGIWALIAMSLNWQGFGPPHPTRGEFQIASYNAYHQSGNQDRFLREVKAQQPAFVLLNELNPGAELIQQFADIYPYQTPCQQACHSLIFSAYPLRFSHDIELHPGWGGKIVAGQALIPGLGPLNIVGAHTPAKIWQAQMNRRAKLVLDQVLRDLPVGKTLLIGDFNDVPWSRRMGQILRDHQLKSAFWPAGTWPRALGSWGVPIDAVFVSPQLRIEQTRAFFRRNHLEPFGPVRPNQLVGGSKPALRPGHPWAKATSPLAAWT